MVIVSIYLRSFSEVFLCPFVWDTVLSLHCPDSVLVSLH